VELNAATRESVPESWHHVPMIGMHAARDLYPTILRRLRAK